MIEPVIVFGTS